MKLNKLFLTLSFLMAFNAVHSSNKNEPIDIDNVELDTRPLSIFGLFMVMNKEKNNNNASSVETKTVAEKTDNEDLIDFSLDETEQKIRLEDLIESITKTNKLPFVPNIELPSNAYTVNNKNTERSLTIYTQPIKIEQEKEIPNLQNYEPSKAQRRNAIDDSINDSPKAQQRNITVLNSPARLGTKKNNFFANNITQNASFEDNNITEQTNNAQEIDEESCGCYCFYKKTVKK